MSIQPTINRTTQALLILSIGVASIIFGGNILKKWLLAQPTLQVLQHDTTEQSANTNVGAIYIIKETTKTASKNQNTEIPIDLPDQLFATPTAPTNSNTTAPDTNTIESAPITDYFQQLATGNHLRLDAVTNNGAIINGKFIEQGQPITQFAYPAPGADENTTTKLLAAHITKIDRESITISEPIAPHRTHILKLN